MLHANVYILDDEPDMLDLLTDVVEDIALVAHGYSNAKTFFDEIQSFEDDSLMVLDLNMPEMDGIEVMRRLASLPTRPALILISGHDSGVLHSAEKLGKAHNLEILDSFDKPIELSRFQRVLLEYSGQMTTHVTVGSALEESNIEDEDVYQALINEEMILHYQPQIDIKTGRLVGCEALIRWQHPKIGLIFPDCFIPVVERNHWMDLMTEWVIKTAVHQEEQWTKMGHELGISVNISAENIKSLSLPEQVSLLLESKRLTPMKLNLEVTESALMGELVTSLDILTRLRLKGVGLSIDDFGTGYSSLSLLHKIPFSELKIDRGFVMSMLNDDEARAIVKTCIMLGHELKMTVVAEGVETEAHLALLKELGCDIAQGYFISRPLPTADFICKYLLNRN